MPKHIIQFNLPEEREELEITNNARRYYLCLWDLETLLRSKSKYSEDNNSVYQEIREKFNEILIDNGVTLD